MRRNSGQLSRPCEVACIYSFDNKLIFSIKRLSSNRRSLKASFHMSVTIAGIIAIAIENVERSLRLPVSI